jgi:hypothetical protein
MNEFGLWVTSRHCARELAQLGQMKLYLSSERRIDGRAAARSVRRNPTAARAISGLGPRGLKLFSAPLAMHDHTLLQKDM